MNARKWRRCYWSAASMREDIQLEAVDFTFGWCFTIPLVLVELLVILVFISLMPNILHLLAIVTAFPLSHSPTHSAFIPARTSQLICVTRSTPSRSRQRSLSAVPLLFVRIRTSSLHSKGFKFRWLFCNHTDFD